MAATLVDLINQMHLTAADLLPKNPLQTRYELDPTTLTGEEYLHSLAERRNQGDVERTARQLLTDFRKGLLGATLLELPPS